MLLMVDNFSIFQLPVAHLKRNLSGKYRVSPIAGDVEPFKFLKTETEHNYPDGAYCFLENKPRVIELLVTDPDVSDVLLPNGDFRNESYEVLSYGTGSCSRRDASQYITPVESLPRSETRGGTGLDVVGATFTNMPTYPEGFVGRLTLEASLREQLLLSHQHPIISLAGPGGIGKTSLTLKVLHDLASREECAFELILWLSSRDIDLSPQGPKQVRPDAISIENFSIEVARLLNPSAAKTKGFRATEYFAQLLASKEDPILCVFDNFETVSDPAEVYRWIDTFVRPPNKVVITTRIREFRGDFPITVAGMSIEESRELILKEASRLGVGDFINVPYLEELHREADGHPYVMKILLGECARERRAVKPQRIVASRTDILGALFERTFDALSPAAQRLFLVMARWRSVVPEVALEAVMLRTENEPMRVEDAINELKRFSLVEEIRGSNGNDAFLATPLARFIHKRPVRWQAAVS